MQDLEREIITQGEPKIENIPKTEAEVFYSILFMQVIEYYKTKDFESSG